MEDEDVETNAPLSELRLASTMRRYERLKVALTVVVLCLNVAIGAYLLRSLDNTKESLTILRCAVDRNVQLDKHGHPRTQEDARKAFDACIAKGR